MHPTRKMVSIQLTKIAESLEICTQMFIIIFPALSGIKNEKLEAKISKQNKKIK